MPARRARMTVVERLVVLAILGILLSVVLPAMQRAGKQTKRHAPAAAAAPGVARPGQEPAGQLNTVEVSDAAQEREKESPSDAAARAVGPAVRLAVLVVVVAVVVNVLRRRMKLAKQ